ncbi:MAG: N-acetylmuramoyl-L-alanine amidase [Paraglaciecola sp.]|uniref:N-acetylmuramoyl-L-alanine amidase n=1 Tax=Paraglaciecola sp. TaxID=1920173 RepID=UPI00273D9E9D|nr:N-acetylmuramoyl-L-alanine amidase [Paraglaciecola sp.]MDP5029273.1 N-acetylmuramoyl-L-alanine amidase [Paraglaciecola sp.]MDP5040627.1 N-acetylmuramoyl-L-alanine amidase [Paraglaciecola sp.]MDP5129501.1 N-acetylmuramoyl-L-alanine amidase [Paraglaciecola sp.]
MNMTAVFLWLACLLLSFTLQAQNNIDGLRIWPSPANTRLVFDLSDSPEFSYFTLSNPERLVIDIANTSNKFNFSGVDNQSDLVKKLRYSTPKDKNAIRVVIELSKKLETTVFSLPPTAPYNDRLVVDISDDKQAPAIVLDAKTASSDRDIIVVIDAGHGGEDPGSIGSAGSYEKDVTLSISKYLENMINSEPGMKAIMTRTGDYYISPNKRPEIARKHKADLLVSIHADAFVTPQPSGASVWVLSMSRANTELGRWMENTEKHSELLGGAAEIIQDTASERYLTQALLDMSMDHSLTTSYDLSRDVISQLKSITKMHKKVPQAASLAVLTSPDIASILVETGFISNPGEEKNLNNARHRQNIARSIFDGVKKHFKRIPPDGSLWAQLKKDHRTHQVRSGESLSLLAQRYNVDVDRLKKANNLRTDVVRIGQILTIPQT